MREGGGRRGKKLRCEMRSRVRMKGWEERGTRHNDTTKIGTH